MDSPSLSLISSLYRPSAHLDAYTTRVTHLAQALHAQAPEFQLELVFVHNAPQADERAQLAQISAQCQALGVLTQTLEVEREPLYASWTRGFSAARAPYVGSLNVDDARYAEGLLAGYRLLEAGAELVDLPYELIQGTLRQRCDAYTTQRISPKQTISPFFLIQRALLARVGGFDPRFRISGDFEWGSRPDVRACRYASAETLSGAFYWHGGNLSSSGNPREWVEINTVLLWRGQYAQLRPVEPVLMRQVWEDWGHTGGDLAPEAADWLWGAGAQARYQRYKRERQQPYWWRRLRMAGARRAWWQSLEYDIGMKHPLRHLAPKPE
jgi:hypothetical protein